MNILANTYRLDDLKWNSRLVNEHKGNLVEIADFISFFEKKPFKVGKLDNKYSDVVVNTSDGGTPVATVSKSYSLIQHFDIFKSISIAFENLGYNIDETECNLYLTEYGERMWLRIQFLKGHIFDPGDGHELIPQLHVRNSVDGSTPLACELGWYRLICENGLMCLDTESRFNKRHTVSLKSGLFIQYLNENISKIQLEKEVYTKWKQKKLNADTDVEILQNWIDTIVSSSWGRSYAERVYSILETGQDAKITRFKDRKTEENKDCYMIRISLEGNVPGAQPAENIYDVANALSWISSHQNSLQRQYKMMLQVPKMLKELENSLE